MTILFCVRVPVLSEQMIVHVPSVSTADNRLTIAFLFAIFLTPAARVTATTVGRLSGMPETIIAMEKTSIVVQSVPRDIPIAKTDIARSIARNDICWASLSRRFWRGTDWTTML